MAKEYCWAITQALRRSCCGRSGSSVLQLGFQPNFPLQTLTADHMHTQLRLALVLPGNNHYESHEMSTYIKVKMISVFNVNRIRNKEILKTNGSHRTRNLQLRLPACFGRLFSAVWQSDVSTLSCNSWDNRLSRNVVKQLPSYTV